MQALQSGSAYMLIKDSGNDAVENLSILLEGGSWFIIKRNPRNSETKHCSIFLLKNKPFGYLFYKRK